MISGAACSESPVELFTTFSRSSLQKGIAVCRRCPSRAECLREALKFPQSIIGVRGGLIFNRYGEYVKIWRGPGSHINPPRESNSVFSLPIPEGITEEEIRTHFTQSLEIE